MRLSTLFAFVLSVGCAYNLQGLLAENTKPPKTTKEYAKFLDGNWEVTGLEIDGKEAPPKALKGMRWSFKNLRVQFIDPGTKHGPKSSVKLDPTKTPKQIDFIGLEDPHKDKVIQGIFKIEKGRLIICVRHAESANKERPKKFTTELDSDLGMITLERIKKE